MKHIRNSTADENLFHDHLKSWCGKCIDHFSFDIIVISHWIDFGSSVNIILWEENKTEIQFQLQSDCWQFENGEEYIAIEIMHEMIKEKISRYYPLTYSNGVISNKRFKINKIYVFGRFTDFDGTKVESFIVFEMDSENKLALGVTCFGSPSFILYNNMDVINSTFNDQINPEGFRMLEKYVLT